MGLLQTCPTRQY